MPWRSPDLGCCTPWLSVLVGTCNGTVKFLSSEMGRRQHGPLKCLVSNCHAFEVIEPWMWSPVDVLLTPARLDEGPVLEQCRRKKHDDVMGEDPRPGLFSA